ncbi:hypothetical protein UC8_50300 [Roseimaritima ulvae]|uniref:Oligosaccharide repeat unit polymerase n=2 Tax=Roseimaritima ulvae TaxID=980254 RepID=A0A5B9QVB6_9BACT|nr:hypothetical protein UC8_50300 [Roseimaritima ulvae]
MWRAYVLTFIAFATLVVLYRVLSTKRRVENFQYRTFVLASHATYVKAWFVTAAIVVLNCSILFKQAGYRLPLLSGMSLDATQYLLYRNGLSEGMNPSIANFNAHLLVPMLVFLSFFCIRRNAIRFRLGSVLLLLLAACFALNRSFLPVSIMISFFSFVACRELPIRNLSKMAMGIVVLGVVSLALVVYSTKSSLTIAGQKMSDRLVHGQWLGMPMYLYYFEDYKITPKTFVHPKIRSVLAMEVPPTPGRELMEYYNPASAQNGTAGTIPTFFIGEAYAVGGWLAVGISVVYVSFVLWGFSFAFDMLPKNHITCCLYGWVAYKVSAGLVCGISAFLVSALTAVLLTLMVYVFVYDSHVRSHRIEKNEL